MMIIMTEYPEKSGIDKISWAYFVAKPSDLPGYWTVIKDRATGEVGTVNEEKLLFLVEENLTNF